MYLTLNKSCGKIVDHVTTSNNPSAHLCNLRWISIESVTLALVDCCHRTLVRWQRFVSIGDKPNEYSLDHLNYSPSVSSSRILQ